MQRIQCPYCGTKFKLNSKRTVLAGRALRNRPGERPEMAVGVLPRNLGMVDKVQFCPNAECQRLVGVE